MCMCVRVQGDGREEVVACAWDGQTYIIDHNRTVVRFQFDENVNAFCAGETNITADSGVLRGMSLFLSLLWTVRLDYIRLKLQMEALDDATNTQLSPDTSQKT